MDAQVARRNRSFLKRAIFVCAGMFLFGFACVPIYRIACEHGYLGGRLRNTPDSPASVAAFTADESRWVTVQFVANVNSALKWQFAPEKVSMRVHPGALNCAGVPIRYASASRLLGPARGVRLRSASPRGWLR